LIVPTAPAVAQFAGSASIDSDYRIRGYSVSSGKPAVSLDLSYDLPSGIYANASAIGGLRHGGDPVLFGTIGDLGYARRIGTKLSIDAGVSRTEYFRRGDRQNEAGYTEIYAGIGERGLSARVYYSFDYFNYSASTLYGELNGGFSPAKNWRLSAHGGVLGYLTAPSYVTRAAQYDWSLAASRQIGAISLHATLSGGGPGRDYYDGQSRDRTALTGGLSWVF
jgi:uncharacterized protein (TIGR02001 family)